MNRFESELLARIRDRDGVAGTRVLVACSGGGDSTALLCALVALRKSLDLELVVAHADHHLRPESGEDARFVEQLCRHLDLDLVEADLDVTAHARDRGLGLETAARELRWTWLQEEAASSGCTLVATGHTLDDHTETVFLRLARGGGTGALTPLPARQGSRWSPLVQCARADLRDYLRARRVPWREDPTNQEDFTPRNRWRKLLVPLRQEAPGLDAALWETHLQVREVLEHRDRWIAAARGPRWELRDGRLWLARGSWDEAELRWVLAAAFEALGLPRESPHLRALSAWAAPHLGGRPKVRSHGTWALSPCGDEPTGWCLHPISRALA